VSILVRSYPRVLTRRRFGCTVSTGSYYPLLTLRVTVTATKTIAYLRVSTDKQADHGVSLDAQRAKVEAYASLYDLELVEVIVDAGASAKTLTRPGLSRALEMLASGEADALLVAKLDRLTRSVRDLDTLIHKHFSNVALLSVAEQIDTRSAAGRLVLNVLASVSQWEREVIGERTKDALAVKRSRGEKTGGSMPYGYVLATDGKTLVQGGPESEGLDLIRELMERPDLSLRGIARELTARGVTPRGKAWYGKSVANIVRFESRRNNQKQTLGVSNGEVRSAA